MCNHSFVMWDGKGYRVFRKGKQTYLSIPFAYDVKRPSETYVRGIGIVNARMLRKYGRGLILLDEFEQK